MNASRMLHRLMTCEQHRQLLLKPGRDSCSMRSWRHVWYIRRNWHNVWPRWRWNWSNIQPVSKQECALHWSFRDWPQSSSEISRVATADTEEMRTAIALSKSEADMNTRRLSAKDELQDILVNAKMNAHQRMATDEQLTRRADGSLGGMPVAKFDQPKHLPVSFSEQPPPKPGRSKTSTTHSSAFQKKQTFL